MKEHFRTDRLTVITILFVSFIAIGLIKYNAPKYEYSISAKEALKKITEGGYVIPVEKALQDNSKNAEKNQFIDLRSKSRYIIGHIDDALHVPSLLILEKDNLKMLRDSSVTYILYGQNQLEANGTWMILNQMGFNNVKILLGGYDNYQKYVSKSPDYIAETGIIEKPICDFTEELNKAIQSISIEDQKASNSGTGQPNKVVITKAKKKAKPKIIPQKKAGGAEEEEGC